VKVRHEGRFLVGGIADVQGDFGGVLVGQRVGGELRDRGTVEWGFTGWTVTDLLVRSKLLVRATRLSRTRAPGMASSGWSRASRSR